MTAEPAFVIGKLSALSGELDMLSVGLANTERALEPIQLEYEEFIGDFEIGLWERHTQHGDKLPAKDLRVQLAHRAMRPELLGKYTGLHASRRRSEKRIQAIKVAIDAQRSILSALKSELEASGASWGRR